MKLKEKLSSLFEAPKRDRPGQVWFDRIIITLIVCNLFAVTFETVDGIYQNYQTELYYFKIFSMIAFSVEYALRVWSSTENPGGKYSAPVKGRLKYMFSPLALVDLLAILPFYLSIMTGVDSRFMRIFRLLWILKFTRYFHMLETMRRVLIRESGTLIAMLIVLFSLLLIVSTIVYFLEKEAQAEVFSSIPQAMWWGMATLTTVGYGDVVPITTVGKLFGGLIMLIGIGMFAIPAGILASAFSEEAKRKNFLVTWKLVAKVPFFKRLEARQIANIVDLLQAHIAMSNDIIVHRDDVGDSMFFILSGEVEVEIPGKPKRLRQGDYFGEIALLYDNKRTATVVALTYTELLQLNVVDFKKLLGENPTLKEHISAIARKRLSSL